MRRLNGMNLDEIIAYNRRDGGTAVSIFADTQADRVNKAREYIAKIIKLEGFKRAVIWEPGCSAGDISGYFTPQHEANGIDVSPAAVDATRSRYPEMHVAEMKVEDVFPQPCDILVLCEFLEHIVDPIKLVRDWMPMAKYVVIGHPLVGDGMDPEIGHLWAYDTIDFDRWWSFGGHSMVEAVTFNMGYRMILGWGARIEA